MILKETNKQKIQFGASFNSMRPLWQSIYMFFWANLCAAFCLKEFHFGSIYFTAFVIYLIPCLGKIHLFSFITAYKFPLTNFKKSLFMLQAFLLIFFSELGDKTFFIAVSGYLSTVSWMYLFINVSKLSFLSQSILLCIYYYGC